MITTLMKCHNVGKYAVFNFFLDMKQIIQKNLAHMRLQARKKQMAQELYYNGNSGQNMLLKPVKPQTNANNRVNNNRPVRDRLGNKNGRQYTTLNRLQNNNAQQWNRRPVNIKRINRGNSQTVPTAVHLQQNKPNFLKKFNKNVQNRPNTSIHLQRTKPRNAKIMFNRNQHSPQKFMMLNRGPLQNHNSIGQSNYTVQLVNDVTPHNGSGANFVPQYKMPGQVFRNMRAGRGVSPESVMSCVSATRLSLNERFSHF